MSMISALRTRWATANGRSRAQIKALASYVIVLAAIALLVFAPILTGLAAIGTVIYFLHKFLLKFFESQEKFDEAVKPKSKTDSEWEEF